VLARLPLSLFLALLVAACAGPRVDKGVVEKDMTRYRFGDPGPEWRRVSLTDNDLAWVVDRSGHTLAVNSTCRDYQDVPLPALLRQQLVGFTQAERVDQQEAQVDGRGALFTRWKARLDGVPVELGLWTLKKDGCIYDFTYTSPLGAYDAESGALTRLVQGFGTERVR
jgi:hypothetical protein